MKMSSNLISFLRQAVYNQNGSRCLLTAKHISNTAPTLNLRPKQQQNKPELCRPFSVTSNKPRKVLLEGNLVQSPLPDLHFPENSPVHEVIFEKCDLFKDDPALSDVATGRTYTFAQLKEKSVRVASALHRKGLKKGDVLLAFSTNQIDFSVLMLASSCLGVWFSAANPSYTADELANQINHCEPKAIFTLPHFVPIVEDALKSEKCQKKVQHQFVFGETSGWQPFQTLLDDDGKAFPDVSINCKEDVYALPYSSGTTGLPKGVMLTHHNIVTNMIQMDKCNGMEKDDSILGLLPLYHAYAQLVTQFGSFYVGGQVHNLSHFEPQSFLKCLQDRKINYANLVPPLILFLTNHPMVDEYDLSNLAYVTCAAAPLGKELTQDFRKRFPHMKLTQGYGLTEASPAISLDTDGRTGSVGPLVPNTIARIVDLETGENLGPNQEGELCASGPQMMKGYFKNPEATDNMLKDGWMYTGDIGYYDEQGLFYISDRLKELIKFKGFQVAPAELEAILLGHPEIADACVIGVPDEKAGEVPKACVVKQPNSDVTDKEIMKYIEDRVSDSKKLRGGVQFLTEIPKNPSGKMLRRLLRK